MTATEAVTWTIDDGVAVVRLDDGKVNVLSHRTIELVHAALDEAQTEARAVAIVGRPGKLSAGFDLTEMTAGLDRTRALVGAGGRLLMRLYGHPQPVVIAVTGHALAAGALLAMTGDTRIAAAGAHKIGLNETAIGMGLPRYAVELARERLTPRALVEGALQATIYDPEGAVAAGFVDCVVPAEECESAAIAEAHRLAEFRSGAYGLTKAQLRESLIEEVLATLDADLASITAPET